jgi:hypothetical protein
LCGRCAAATACSLRPRAGLTPALPQVELVTEGLPFWEPPSAVQVVAVPAEFTPAKGSQGRARALQYAAQHSEATAGDWVVHLGAASVLRERTVRAGRCPPVMRAALTRPRPAQVDAILAHVVDEAFRLSAARCGNSERHTAHYGRIAQARSPQAMRGLRDALTPPALCRGPCALGGAMAAGQASSATRAARARRTVSFGGRHVQARCDATRWEAHLPASPPAVRVIRGVGWRAADLHARAQGGA